MTVNITKPTLGATSGWGTVLNTALDAIVTEVNVHATALGNGTFAPVLPTAGSFTYNPDGTVASDPDGNTYTWNTDGTPHTQTKGGVTRTFTWNTDGTLASVA